MSEHQVSLPPEAAAQSDEEIVAYTQSLRKGLVDEITADGFPKEGKERFLLLTALTDMDRTALSKMKIGSKERQGTADREAGMIAARLFAKYGGKSPFERPVIEGETVHREIPQLETDGLEPLELVAGETDIGLANRNFDEFIQEMEGDQK